MDLGCVDVHYIGAVLGEACANHLRGMYEDPQFIRSALKSAHLAMCPSYKRFGDYHFKARIGSGGQLIMDVPGDACGLYVSGHGLERGHGPMRLDCHNVDQPIQSLALFAGLAAFSGHVRKLLYG